MTHPLESITNALAHEEYVWTGELDPRIAEIWDTLAARCTLYPGIPTVVGRIPAYPGGWRYR